MNSYQISYIIYLLQYFIVIPIGYWLSTVERASLPEKSVLDEIERWTSKSSTKLYLFGEKCDMEMDGVSVVDCDDGLNKDQVLCNERVREIMSDMSLSDVNTDEALRRQIASTFSTDSSTIMFVHLSSSFTSQTSTIGQYLHGWIRSSSCKTAKEIMNEITTRSKTFPGLALTYKFTFSLVSERPVRDHLVSWNFQELKHKFIDPFVNEIQDVASVEIRSREMYHIEITSSKKKKKKDVLTLSDLERFLGMHDWDFGTKSKGDRQKQFHFILYIPEDSRRPLLLEKSGAHAFLVPDWGGVSILNEDNISGLLNETIMRDHMSTLFLSHTHLLTYPLTHLLIHTHTHTHTYYIYDQTGTFLFQLRNLLGISNLFPPTIKYAPGSGISTWEADFIRKNQVRVLTENIKRTLKSSIDLMESMPHLNVPNHVSEKMRVSIDSLREGMRFVKKNDLTRGLSHLRDSMQVANEVYYDHDTVPQEYFVTEHLAAVYLPLLLPLILPLIVAGKTNFLIR